VEDSRHCGPTNATCGQNVAVPQVHCQVSGTDSSGNESESDTGSEGDIATQKLLQNLQEHTKETATDAALCTMMWRNFPAIHRAQAKLTVASKDKKLNIFYRGQLTGMVGTLNLYLDTELSFTWRQASVLASKAAGHGLKHAHNLHAWIHQYLSNGKLPLHQYG